MVQFFRILLQVRVYQRLFESLDNISRSIRTASSGVEAAKAEGIAKITLTNEDPGNILLLHLELSLLTLI